MSRLVIFDDRTFQFTAESCRPDFGPISDLRAFFEIRTGAVTTAERLARESPDALAAVYVPDELANLVATRWSVPVNRLPPDETSFLLVNGRWSFPGAKFELEQGQAIIEQPGGAVVATELSRDHAQRFLTTGALPDDVETLEHDGQLLVRRPWELIALLSKTLLTDLLMMPEVQAAGNAAPEERNLPPGVNVVGEEAVAIDLKARVYPGVTIDVENGPVMIEPGATIRPGAIICGPTYIGRSSTVLDRALIRPDTVIGPVCKVAGEVISTVFQGFSNKAHDGFLGHSLVGEWVNFGAGTTNSNLLNTYGEILMRMRPNGHHERTGLMYLGAIIGDHAKFAINTRLMTGSVIGTGSMIATTAAPHACVGAFAWLTDRGERRYQWEKFIDVANTVMARRNVDLSDEMFDCLKALHAKAAGA